MPTDRFRHGSKIKALDSLVGRTEATSELTLFISARNGETNTNKATPAVMFILSSVMA